MKMWWAVRGFNPGPTITELYQSYEPTSEWGRVLETWKTEFLGGFRLSTACCQKRTMGSSRPIEKDFFMSECDCHIEITDKAQSGVLIKLLVINAIMFVIELGIGWYAQSTGLIADAMDMLADATVYGIGLYAVGRAAKNKAHAALISGWFQLALGILILIDIARRILVGSDPQSVLMVSIGIVALAANIICLKLIEQHRHGEVHMRASWIFSKNDVIANAGVIIGGLLVWLLDNRWPDLIIGCLIALVVLNGARRIIQDARSELAIEDACCGDSECESSKCSSGT